jgi:hypothetical protein
MSNFFLLNEALPQNNFEEFKDGFKEIASIEKENHDVFLRHDSLWQLDFINELYLNYTSQEESVICKFIEQLSNTENYFNNSKEFDGVYKEDSNGFLGIIFSHLDIEDDRRIRNNKEYSVFNFNNLWNVNFRNFWNKREKLFPNLIMCGQVQNQINLIGNSGYFNQIIEKLKEFNLAVSDWKTGNFSYREINNCYALRISPESDITMSRYGNERICQLPNGGTDFFELHIKTGDLRFHFLPDNKSKKVYVGYIGPHLTTATN